MPIEGNRSAHTIKEVADYIVSNYIADQKYALLLLSESPNDAEVAHGISIGSFIAYIGDNVADRAHLIDRYVEDRDSYDDNYYVINNAYDEDDSRPF